MKNTKLLMGMPITVEIVDEAANAKHIDRVFKYFHWVDEKFSTYKETSEITLINRGVKSAEKSSKDMKLVLALCEETKKLTDGYFDISHNDNLDPSGLVKGWSILNAAKLIEKMGFLNFYVEAGGDIQVCGKNAKGEGWRVGIRNPFNVHEIVKVVSLNQNAIATSGTYFRGQHVYDPVGRKEKIDNIVSLSVIGPDIYEADRFATAAFAMGDAGILFIEELDGFEGYMIDKNGVATYTTGFEKYVV